MVLCRLLRAVTLFPKGSWIDGVIWTLTVEAVFYLVIFLILLAGQTARLPFFARCALIIISGFWALVVLSYPLDMGSVGSAAQALAFAYPSRVFLLTPGTFFLLGIFAYALFDRAVPTDRLASLERKSA